MKPTKASSEQTWSGWIWGSNPTQPSTDPAPQEQPETAEPQQSWSEWIGWSSSTAEKQEAREKLLEKKTTVTTSTQPSADPASQEQPETAEPQQSWSEWIGWSSSTAEKQEAREKLLEKKTTVTTSTQSSLFSSISPQTIKQEMQEFINDPLAKKYVKSFYYSPQKPYTCTFTMKEDSTKLQVALTALSTSGVASYEKHGPVVSITVTPESRIYSWVSWARGQEKSLYQELKEDESEIRKMFDLGFAFFNFDFENGVIQVQTNSKLSPEFRETLAKIECEHIQVLWNTPDKA